MQSYSQSSNSETGSDQEAAPGKKAGQQPDYMPVMNEMEILDNLQRELAVDQQVEIIFY